MRMKEKQNQQLALSLGDFEDPPDLDLLLCLLSLWELTNTDLDKCGELLTQPLFGHFYKDTSAIDLGRTTLEKLGNGILL